MIEAKKRGRKVQAIHLDTKRVYLERPSS